MPKKILLILPLLLVLFSGASYADLYRLTVINKSKMPVELTMTGQDEDGFYVLRVPGASRGIPTEQIFTIAPDTYTTSLFYVEIYDPVYGYTCDSKSQELQIYRNVRLVIYDCNHSVRRGSEPPSQIKYGAMGRGRR